MTLHYLHATIMLQSELPSGRRYRSVFREEFNQRTFFQVSYFYNKKLCIYFKLDVTAVYKSLIT
jgi:hypothetical protein